MATWSGRSTISTTYELDRLGGSYLTDVSGNYITTSLGERIVVIVPGGDLNFVPYTQRTPITTNWTT